jgi:DNA-binding transcriptional MerR regulator
MKSWKSLFIKEEEEKTNPPSFPISNTVKPSNPGQNSEVNFPKTEPVFKMDSEVRNSVFEEVLSVYAKGLDSINMPGYDFYEFYMAIDAIKEPNEIAYQMAFKMAKTMDTNLSTSKMVQDADFYLSKIKEVHKQYETQGKQKLKSLESEMSKEESELTKEITKMNSEIESFKSQISALEKKSQKASVDLKDIPKNYEPKLKSIEEKMNANHKAMEISVNKINLVKEGIQKYLS